MNNVVNRFKVIYNHLKDRDIIYVLKGIKKRIISSNISFGLKRDLTVPFKNPKAKINLSIRLFEERDAEYFDMTHTEDGLINENIPNCYVAVDDYDVPCFRQWLINSNQNKKIQNYFGDMFPHLKHDEALFEGGFVPPKTRGIGIMPAGLSIIAEQAKNDGMRSMITFVDIGNTASLKGCTRAGLYPYILRTEKWFLFNRKIRFTDIPEDLMKQYLKDVVGKPKPLVNSLHLL